MKFRLSIAPRNIVIRLPNWVGDILMTRQAVQGFRGLWPDARFIGMVRLQHQELVKRFDLFDDLLCAPEGSGLARAISVREAAVELRVFNADLAVVLSSSFESALTARFAGIPVRVGHDTDRRGILLTSPIPFRFDAHRAESFNDVARFVGAHVPETLSPLALTEADRGYADRLFRTMAWEPGVRPVFLNPAAAKAPRAWSSDRFRSLAEHLVSGAEARPVVLHARPPFGNSAGWAERHGIAIVDDVSLPELAALLERCELYVGNDSGPAHLAAALGIRTVTIFGSSVAERTGPIAMAPVLSNADTERHVAVTASYACAPCRERFFVDCPSPPTAGGQPPCLDAVTLDAVKAAIGKTGQMQ